MERLMLLEMKVFAIAMDPFTNAPIVILKDADEINTLPVWIGVLEAGAIASGIEKVRFSRPMSHDLMGNLLKTLGLKLEKVEIADIRDNVYYASIHIVSKDKVAYTLDARPSDAIALALRMEAPIYVDTVVLDKSTDMDLGSMPGKDGGKKTGTEDILDLLEELSPEAFGKYKM